MYSVIFIDDEDIIRENIYFTADYEGNGFEIKNTFADIDSAEEYMKSNHVDLAMVDIVIGEKLGLDFAEMCENKYPDTVVIIISAYKEFEYARRAIDCNVFKFLSKPTKYDEFNAVLKKVREKLEKINSVNMVNVGNSEDNLKVDKIIKYINDNIFEDKNMTRQSVSEYIGMTPTYFSKWFKNKFNKSYVSYINEVKIHHAMKLLSESDMSLNDICLVCSYYTLHYFVNKFYEMNGITPTEYRNKYRRHTDNESH